MKLSHLGVALLVAGVVYLSGTLLASDYNQAAFERLSDHAVRLEENVEQLRRLNARLAATVELYRRSPDAVAVEARRLQYYEPGQQVIRTGDAHRGSLSRSPGTILRRPEQGSDRRSYVRAAALVAFALALFLQLLVDSERGRGAQEIRRASR